MYCVYLCLFSTQYSARHTGDPQQLLDEKMNVKVPTLVQTMPFQCELENFPGTVTWMGEEI